MKATIAVLPGDGIGPEVVAKSVELLSVIAAKYDHEFTFVEGLIGGIAIDEKGDPLPAETIAICENADAILLGAVGGRNGPTRQRRFNPSAVCWVCVSTSVYSPICAR